MCCDVVISRSSGPSVSCQSGSATERYETGSVSFSIRRPGSVTTIVGFVVLDRELRHHLRTDLDVEAFGPVESGGEEHERGLIDAAQHDRHG